MGFPNRRAVVCGSNPPYGQPLIGLFVDKLAEKSGALTKNAGLDRVGTRSRDSFYLSSRSGTGSPKN